jgi:branched-chain amino acid transport system permease protein
MAIIGQAPAPAVVRAPRARGSLELAAKRRRFRAHGGLAVALAVLLIVAPSAGLKSNDVHLIAIAAVYAITIMGLNLVFGLAGQVTLGPAATFAVGAYAGGLLTTKLHWNPFLAVIPAVVAALVVGLLIGAPALRVGGFYLAMVTAIAALAVPSTIQIFQKTTGGDDGLLAKQFSLGSGPLSDISVYRLIIVVTLLAGLVAANVSRSSWGRWFRCLQVNEPGTSALGVSVYRAKVLSFALSSVFGGLAGALFSPFEIAIGPAQFGFDLSIAFFVSLVIGGLGSAWGPVLGTALYFLGPRYLLPHSVTGLWQQLIFAVMIVVVVVTLPDGLASAVGRASAAVWRRVGGRDQRTGGPGSQPGPRLGPAGEPSDGRTAEEHRAVAVTTREELPGLLRRAGTRAERGPVLVASGVVQRFGGVVALDNAGVSVEPGRITALIGPNGSGKTTLLNVCSGFQSPNAGRVELAGADVTGRPPHRRAEAGLARTFQHPIVFGDLTGAENVMAGSPQGRPTGWAAALTLPSSRRHERVAAERAEALLDALGAAHLITRPAARISMADARILDLARALALDPLVLVLDEPAAGLGLDEVAMLEALVRATASSGVGVLLVEHDVAFVTRMADHVVALERGRVIAEGPPAEVRAHPAVLTSYFGDLEAPA